MEILEPRPSPHVAVKVAHRMFLLKLRIRKRRRLRALGCVILCSLVPTHVTCHHCNHRDRYRYFSPHLPLRKFPGHHRAARLSSPGGRAHQLVARSMTTTRETMLVDQEHQTQASPAKTCNAAKRRLRTLWKQFHNPPTKCSLMGLKIVV